MAGEIIQECLLGFAAEKLEDVHFEKVNVPADFWPLLNATRATGIE